MSVAATHRPFDRDLAFRMAPQRQFVELRQVLEAAESTLLAEVEARFWGFSRAAFRENPDNAGLYVLQADFPVPFLWIGLGWGADDAPGTLPSWGASLEVSGPLVEAFERGAGGLQHAWNEAARASDARLGLYRFGAHVELAEWRGFDWLLAEPDQNVALIAFWAEYLDVLARANVPEAVDEFVEECARR